MSIEFSTYLLPIVVALYWVFKIFITKSPVYPVHKLGSAALLAIAVGLIATAALNSPQIPHNIVTMALMTISVALFPPFYHLYIRKKTDIEGIKPLDYVMFLPAFFLLIGHLFIIVTLPDDGFQDTVINEVMNLHSDHNHEAACKIAFVVFAFYYIAVPLLLVLDAANTVVNEKKYNKMTQEWNPADKDILDSRLKKAIYLDVLTAVLLIILILIPVLHLPVWLIQIISLLFAGLLYFCGYMCYNTQYCASKMYEDFCSQELTMESAAKTATVDDPFSEAEETAEEEQSLTATANAEMISPATSDDAAAKGEMPEAEAFSKDDKAKILHSANIEGFEDVISDNFLRNLKHPEQRDNEKQMITEADLRRIETDHLFLDPNLTLPKLADTLGTNRTYLTNAIRYYYHTNLAGYIKDLRIEYAMMLIETRPISKVNLSEISMDCGYNNIATFYRDFASVVGIAPKQYFTLRRVQ